MCGVLYVCVFACMSICVESERETEAREGPRVAKRRRSERKTVFGKDGRARRTEAMERCRVRWEERGGRPQVTWGGGLLMILPEGHRQC